MSLIEKIDVSIKSAMKSKDSLALESLRAIKSAILLFKTQSGSSNDLSTDDEIKILQKLVKQRKESADIYKNQNSLAPFIAKADRRCGTAIHASFAAKHCPTVESGAMTRRSWLRSTTGRHSHRQVDSATATR